MFRCAALLLAFVPAAAMAQDVQRGRELATRWCTGCHAVERLATQVPVDAVPTFPAIAARPDVSPESLRAAMTPLHSRMPDFSLGKRQQDDLIAYIQSLRQR